MQNSDETLTGDGSPAGADDRDIVNGMSPEACADRICDAVSARQRDVYVGGMKEHAVPLASRWPPDQRHSHSGIRVDSSWTKCKILAIRTRHCVRVGAIGSWSREI